MSALPMPPPNEITIGRGPCELWHFIGNYVVAPFKVRPDMLRAMPVKMGEKERHDAIMYMVAVMEASKAINRMMGRPEMYGSGLETKK